MHRARERARLEHPRDIDAAALEITADGEARPADQHHHVAAIACAAQRLDEHPHLGHAESDSRAEHEPARVGGRRGKGGGQRAPIGASAAGPAVGGSTIPVGRGLQIGGRPPRLGRGPRSEVGWVCARCELILKNNRPAKYAEGKAVIVSVAGALSASFRACVSANPEIQTLAAAVLDSGFRLAAPRNDGPADGAKSANRKLGLYSADARIGDRPHQGMDRHRRTGDRAGRAAARREHRHRGARHGEFRPDPAAPRQAARRLAEHPCAARRLGRRHGAG